MGIELLLTDVVEGWARDRLPDDPGAASAAAGVALDSLAAGASFAEACEEARRLLDSRGRHPSHLPVTRLTLVS